MPEEIIAFLKLGHVVTRIRPGERYTIVMMWMPPPREGVPL